MSNDLALHRANTDLAAMSDRFDALAAVTGAEMPRVIKPPVVPIVTVLTAAISGAAQARWGLKATLGSAAVAAGAYLVGFGANENADLRWGAYSLGMGLGAAAAALTSHDQTIKLMAATVAPAPGPALPAAA